MTYNCNLEKQDENMFTVSFPDLPNVMTFGTTHEHAVEMAQEALDGVLISCIENNFPIPDKSYSDGVEIEVSPKIAFSIELRKARSTKTQTEIASQLGITQQQYQKLENPTKTNPTLETLYKLQKLFAHQFLTI